MIFLDCRARNDGVGDALASNRARPNLHLPHANPTPPPPSLPAVPTPYIIASLLL
jgi:hypothetical protein